MPFPKRTRCVRACSSEISTSATSLIALVTPFSTPSWLTTPDGPQVLLLGPADITGSVDPTPLLTQPRRVALLSVLITDGGRGFVRRDRIAALLWPDLDTAAARAALRKAVHAVRQVLGDTALVARGDEEIRIDPSIVWSDILAFDDAHANSRHGRALELYRGPLLDGFISGVDGYDRWLDGARAVRAERALSSAWALAKEFEAGADFTRASHWARQVARLAGTDERRVRGAMELLERTGNRADALRIYEEFAIALRRDYDARPAAETQAVATRIRAG